MSYQVLARKYRPQTFEDIIGQGPVATTLTNALKNKKVAHAYLFSGPRGVGKTTTARILAKALNCVKGPTPVPCNACDSCLRIAQGQELVDVLEIDAASNRGIEEIRELRDNVRYAPARSRFKVYIVDEAHQITHDAFNAFLKTLEEPPEHAVFVLATTEHQKIPATILSRCQLFRFKRVSAEEITKRLQKIVDAEKISVEPAALGRLARAAGGSVRDALSLLDQALAYASGTLTAKQVEVLLGFLPDEFLVGFASALLERKPEGVLQWIKQLSEEGWEIPQFVRDFREFLREQLVTQLSASAPTPRRSDTLLIAGRDVSLPEVLQMIKVFGQCLDEMRWSDSPQLILELYSLRLTQPFVDATALLRRIEQLEKGQGQTEPTPAAPARPAVPNAPSVMKKPSASPPTPATPRAEPTSGSSGSSAPVATAAPATSPIAQASGDSAILWKQLLSELWKKPGVASQMERAFLKTANGNEWVIGLPDKFAFDSVQRAGTFVEETLAKIAGRKITVRLIEEARAATTSDESEILVAPVADEHVAHAMKDEKVQKILTMFKGKIRQPESSES